MQRCLLAVQALFRPENHEHPLLLAIPLPKNHTLHLLPLAIPLPKNHTLHEQLHAIGIHTLHQQTSSRYHHDTQH